MIVMFTLPAYSAVHSNNLQSGYPEGRYRLKMSNLFPVRHACRDVVLITGGFQHNVVKADTSCYTHLLTNIPCLIESYMKDWPRGWFESGLCLCQVCSQIIPYFCCDSEIMKQRKIVSIQIQHAPPVMISQSQWLRCFMWLVKVGW